MKSYLFSTFLWLWPFCFSAQDIQLIDSLEHELKNHRATRLELGKNTTSTNDTIEADILIELSRAYRFNSPELAMQYASQALELAEQIDYKKGLANGNNAIGVIHFQRGEYPRALMFYDQALQIRLHIGDEKGVASIYNNIGEVYRLMGQYPEALRNHLLALKQREKISDAPGMGRSYNNIGLVYMNQGNNPEALKNYKASLSIAEEFRDQQVMAVLYNNIGIIETREGNFREGLQNFETSLRIATETSYRQLISANHLNIGGIYQQQGKYPLALDHYHTSLAISEELDDKQCIANCYYNIGSIYILLNKLTDASAILRKSLLISTQMGHLEGIKNSYKGLASLDSAQGNFNKSLEHYKLFILYRDSLVNEEITRQTVQQQMQFDFDKQQSLLNAEQEMKDAVAQEELQKHKLIRNGFIGGFSIVMLFASVVLLQRNKISKEKKISETERQKSDAAKQRSDDLLLNILPLEIAEELKVTGVAKPRSYTMVTVMFTDFKDFTLISERVSAELMVDEINTCFSAFDQIVEKYNIEKIKTIGDAYLCAAGLPVPTFSHATDMVNAAVEILDFMHCRRLEKEARGEIAFEIRVGIHTGPLVAGVVGRRKYAYDIWGDTVNLAARMEQNSDVGKINISGITHELIKGKFCCTHRGRIKAKNKGEVDMYFVEKMIGD